jgi:hypothetical protein
MDIIQQAYENIEREIANLETCRLLAQRLPEIANIHQIYPVNGHLCITTPDHKEHVSATLKLLAEYRWTVISDKFSPIHGIRFIELTHPECAGHLSLLVRQDLAGSTCKLNVIGYEQKPIYEVTCLEAEPLLAQ